MEFRSLETFYWVARLGSFGAAARKLNTSQPAISQRIAVLEQALGSKVVVRGARQITMTSVGRELLVYSEKLLGLRAEMMARLVNTGNFQGILRLGVSETLVHTWLPEFIKAAKAEYPKLSIEIDVDTSPSLRAKLLAQQIELAFMIGPISAAGVRNRELGSYRLGFLASPDLGLAETAGLADIAAHPIYTFSRQTQPYENVRSIFQAGDLPPVSLNASASMSTVARIAIDGLGIAIIPLEIVRHEMAAGRLIEICRQVKLPDLCFSATWLVVPDSVVVEALAEIAVGYAKLEARAQR
ncbi:MAG TPA: LysR family transcriptional regulator [Hyphomicrobiaceae bacterium]|nr:LysR family transcriptional regulator [Hyphomicrobiaceae bacterium]